MFKKNSIDLFRKYGTEKILIEDNSSASKKSLHPLRTNGGNLGYKHYSKIDLSGVRALYSLHVFTFL